MANDLKKRMNDGDVLIGAWLSVPSVYVAEALGSCGFDWMAVDMEHGPVSVETAVACFIAAERRQTAPLVRLPSADPIMARRLLDGGAAGLLVPAVESADQFASFARHCLYPPKGSRGVGLSRCNRWGDDFDSYFRDFAPVLVPQIETAAGIEAADAIASLEEVDALFVGPYDLSTSLGQPGDFATSAFTDAMATLRAACERQGKALGMHQVAPVKTELEARIAEGYRFIAYGTDMLAMRHAFKDMRD